MGKKKETVQKVEVPRWIEAASQNAIGRAQTFANRPIEGFSADQSTAFQKIRDMAASPPAAAGAQIYANTPAFELSADKAMSNYFNPYVDAALQPAIRKIMEAADRSRQQIGAQAHIAGAFGDARHGVRENELDAITQQAVGDTSADFFSQAFRDAMGLEAQRGEFQERGLDRFLAGSGAQQNSMLQAINALLSSGTIQHDQPVADELARINTILAAVRGAPEVGTKTTTTPDSGGWGLLGSILGAGLAPFTGGASLALGPLSSVGAGGVPIPGVNPFI